MKITIDIPDGPMCLDHNLKRCKLCSYDAHMQAYNCLLYGRLLNGGNIPIKCPECFQAGGQERS